MCNSKQKFVTRPHRSKTSSIVCFYDVFLVKMSKRYLTEAELLEEAHNSMLDGFQSEDGLDSEDDSDGDVDYIPADDDDQTTEEETDEQPSTSTSSNHNDGNNNSDYTRTCSVTTQGKMNLVWKKKNLQVNVDQLRFLGNDSLPANILALDTPYRFFKYFFTDDIISNIVQQSNLYSVQTNVSRPVGITTTDIRQYIGICIIMSLVKAPNVRSYWASVTGNETIRNCMPLNKFEKIRRYLHFNDNTKMLPVEHPDHDRIHKIRPLYRALNDRFSTIPPERFLSIDEQICSCKSRHYLKQYMPLKPHKWGFKFFVLSGVSGFAYNIELYAGQENITMPDEPDLGAAANVVVRLCRLLQRNLYYRVFFDNYYSTVPLVTYLAKQGILSLGTIRRNRINNCKLPTDKDWKKEPRGSFVEYVTNYEGVDISTSVWKDNKMVHFISSFAGEHPHSTVKRFDKKKREKTDIPSPYVLMEYNRHMGGVDLLDSILARYKILVRSKKWYFRIFYHLLDITLANSWLLYRRVNESLNERGKENENRAKGKLLSFSEFRAEVALVLCQMGQGTARRSSGRPALETMEHQLQAKKKKGPTVYIPPKDVRTDGMLHIPIVQNARQRCKRPQCKHLSYIQCEKCSVHLCLNKNNNCFKDFHCT